MPFFSRRARARLPISAAEIPLLDFGDRVSDLRGTLTANQVLRIWPFLIS
jgi:hypothetical protein